MASCGLFLYLSTLRLEYNIQIPAFSYKNEDDDFLTILKQIQLLWE